MADTYHPQQFFERPSPQVTATSSEVPADSIIPQPYDRPGDDGLMPAIMNVSTQIPMHQEIISQMELYAPGLLTSWPDDKKPQYRIPEYATEVAPPDTGFPALTVAF